MLLETHDSSLTIIELAHNHKDRQQKVRQACIYAQYGRSHCHSYAQLGAVENELHVLDI